MNRSKPRTCICPLVSCRGSPKKRPIGILRVFRSSIASRSTIPSFTRSRPRSRPSCGAALETQCAAGCPSSNHGAPTAACRTSRFIISSRTRPVSTYVFLEPADGRYHRWRISSGVDRTDADLDEIVRRLAVAPLSYEPGAGWGYSMAIDVLGAVIEKVTRQPLPQAVSELVFTPLDMRDTGFAVVDTGRLVVHYADGKPAPRRLAADDQVSFFDRPVAFSPVRLLSPGTAFPSGGDGMAGTATDVLKFLETIRAGGLLQEQTQKAMFSVQARTGGQAEGPGWEFGFGGAVLVDPKAAGTPQASGTLQWNGAYGHKWFIDPANELTVVALTNTAFEGMIGRFPVDIRDAVYGE
jgi:CubicO group peptidase (beta-lactamase class C family)